tara:strand:+ start:457 stop:618 length:162 start_codon:yes stop_codon:yes gene_type:complete
MTNNNQIIKLTDEERLIALEEIRKDFEKLRTRMREIEAKALAKLKSKKSVGNG